MGVPWPMSTLTRGHPWVTPTPRKHPRVGVAKNIANPEVPYDQCPPQGDAHPWAYPKSMSPRSMTTHGCPQEGVHPWASPNKAASYGCSQADANPKERPPMGAP